MYKLFLALMLYLAGFIDGANFEPPPEFVHEQWKVWGALVCAFLFLKCLMGAGK
jgi:hypothetical protein